MKALTFIKKMNKNRNKMITKHQLTNPYYQKKPKMI